MNIRNFEIVHWLDLPETLVAQVSAISDDPTLFFWIGSPNDTNVKFAGLFDIFSSERLQRGSLPIFSAK